MDGLASLDDIFENCVHTDIFSPADTSGPGDSDNATAFFEIPLSPSKCKNVVKTAPMPDWDTFSCSERVQRRFCRLEGPAASPAAASSQGSVYPYFQGKAAASEPELFSLTDILQEQPQSPKFSPPLSPIPSAFSSPRVAKFEFSIVKAHQLKKTRSKINTLLNMMRTSPYRDENEEIRAGRIKAASQVPKLPVMAKNHLPASPPTSGKLPQTQFQDPYSISKFNYGIESQDAYDLNCTLESHQFGTPVSSPTTDIDDSSFQAHNPINDESLRPDLSGQATRHPLSRPISADMNVAIQYPTSASHIFTTAIPNQPQPYWQQQSTASTNLASTGLLIRCNPVAADIHGIQLPFDNNEAPGASPRTPFAESPGLTGYAFPEDPTHETSYLQSEANITNHQPVLPREPSSAQCASQFPLASEQYISPRRPSRSNHRRRRSSSTIHPRPNPMPHVQSSSIDFVNFTPDDSRKILTGVAPSGSSKTKARREKEAAEKRRKLSQAARAVVLEVGGDIRLLEREGLLADS